MRFKHGIIRFKHAIMRFKIGFENADMNHEDCFIRNEIDMNNMYNHIDHCFSALLVHRTVMIKPFLEIF